MKHPFFFVPANFNPESVLDQNKVLRDRARVRDIYYYLVGTIIRLECSKYDARDGEEARGTVCLYSTLLQKAIGNGYNRYLLQLEYARIIERFHTAEKGRHSNEFRLMEPYRTAPRCRVDLKDLRLVRQYRRMAAEKGRNDKQALARFRFLARWLDPIRLKVDQEAALHWVDRYEGVQLEKVRQVHLNDQIRTVLISRISEAAATYRTRIRYLAEGYFPVPRFDQFGFRCYSTLTNLKNSLRCFVAFDTEVLVSIDIKNSQPYFSIPVFYGPSGPSSHAAKARKEIRNWMESGPGSKRKQEEESIMLYELFEMQAGLGLAKGEPGQEPVFRSLVLSGTLYDWLQDHLSGKFFRHGIDQFGTRGDAKARTMWFFYHDPANREQAGNGYYQPIESFKALFPNEFAIMERIKHGNYKRFSRLLQRIESHIVLNKACRRLNKDYPEIPLFPIHDCIVTTQPHAGTVQEILAEECTSLVGAPPILDVKTLDPQLAHNEITELKNKPATQHVLELLDKYKIPAKEPLYLAAGGEKVLFEQQQNAVGHMIASRSMTAA